jgi:polysaccharide export outer membrane protein
VQVLKVLMPMKLRLFQFSRGILFVLPIVVLGLAGCVTPDNQAAMTPPNGESNSGDTNGIARLHIGDVVTVVLSGLPDELLPQEKPIKEDGTISLTDIGSVKAAGKTAGELEDYIQKLYVPKFYTHLTVTVKTTGDRVYYVRGEVKSPGRLIYAGQITVTKAITSAGDYTDFANHKKVLLIRASGQRFKINCDAILNGEQPDPPVYPGDQIQVPRSLY